MGRSKKTYVKLEISIINYDVLGDHKIIYAKTSEQFPNLFSVSVIFPWCNLEFWRSSSRIQRSPISGRWSRRCLHSRRGRISNRIHVFWSCWRRTLPLKTHLHYIAIANDLRPYHLQSKSTLEYLHAFVDRSAYVSSCPKQLLFELPEIPDEIFKELHCLENLAVSWNLQQ